MTLWYLFLLASIAAVAWVIWTYRKRASQKAAASSVRMRELLAVAPRFKTPMAAASVGLPSARSAATQAAAVYARKERLLGQPETLLFHRLKTGLPDHEVFPNVSLSAVVDISATVRGCELELLRRPLAVHCIDFLVCDRSTGIVAAVEFETAAETAKFKIQCLGAAGIRHIRINPKAIPEQQDVRDLIFGVHSGVKR